jgi:outer membrane protein assembly factor BamD
VPVRLNTPVRLLALALVSLLAACGGRVRIEAAETLPVDAMYIEAKTALDNNEIDRAVKFYERLVARFPYGRYHEQAQIELAYALYRDNKPDEALSAINRFIKIYPTHARIDYAYYLRGIVNFNRRIGLLEKYFAEDATRRDLQYTRQSFQDFGELVNKYPDSGYAADARQRMIHLRNSLANSELMVASYYFRRGAYIAAASRAKFLLETYQEAPASGDALAILSESYRRIGRTQLGDEAAEVLKLNYPEHPYLAGDWPAKRSKWKQLNPFSS